MLSGEGADHRSMSTGEFWRFSAGEWKQLSPHPGRSRWAPSSFVLNGYVYLFNGVVRQYNAADQWPATGYRFHLG